MSAWHWHAVAWSHAPDGLVCVLGHRHLSHKSQGLWRWETQRHDTPDQQQDFDLVTLLGRDRGGNRGALYGEAAPSKAPACVLVVRTHTRGAAPAP